MSEPIEKTIQPLVRSQEANQQRAESSQPRDVRSAAINELLDAVDRVAFLHKNKLLANVPDESMAIIRLRKAAERVRNETQSESTTDSDHLPT